LTQIGHFVDILPSQSRLGTVTKQVEFFQYPNINQQK